MPIAIPAAAPLVQNAAVKAAQPQAEMLAMLGMDTMATAPAAGAGAFSSVLHDAIAQVEAFQNESTKSISEFLSGSDIELHQVALNVQKAETAFELFAEVRNKVVQAYQEVMRMQV